MSTITAEEHVRIPPARAARRLEAALARVAPDHRLALRVPAREFGIPADLALEHDVAVAFAPAPDRTGLNEAIGVRWEPLGDRVVPAFAGLLAADCDDTGQQSVFTIEGSYEPPGGLAGEAFEESLGFWLARATMHDLLARLAAAAEEIDDESTGLLASATPGSPADRPPAP